VLAEDLEGEDPLLRQDVGLYSANLRPTGATDPEVIEQEQRSLSALLARLTRWRPRG